MKIDDFLPSPASACLTAGPQDWIVLTSRVRLARNVRGFPFPGWAKKPDRFVPGTDPAPGRRSHPDGGGFAESMDTLTAIEKQILMERHLISREHAARGAGSGLVLSRDLALGVMINEEDHLRMQAIRPGLDSEPPGRPSTRSTARSRRSWITPLPVSSVT
jgi:protein arginine kinase